MSYDVNLMSKEGKILNVGTHTEGGTYAMSGSNEARLNITYNYSKYYNVLGKKGLRGLDKKQAKDCINKLRRAVKQLGIIRSNNYWESTPGNAGYALAVLLDWAQQHPDGVFEVS